MDRRSFVKGAGFGALSLQVLSLGVFMTPAQAAAKRHPFNHLDSAEAEALAALGEALAPGARQAGVAYFIDYQLGLDPNDCLLMAKYFNVKPPYLDFYRGGIRALNAYTQATYGQAISQLDAARMQASILAINSQDPPNWAGPPAPLFYLLVRSDAVDVVYGTEQGFERLGIPYMGHIAPPQAWV